MDKHIIERAVEAAAQAQWDDTLDTDSVAWVDLPDAMRDICRNKMRCAVTAALAEVESSLTAELEAVYETLKPINDYVISKNYTTLAGGVAMVRNEVGLVMRDLAWATADRDDHRCQTTRSQDL